MSARDAAIREFLAGCGLAGALRTPLAGDASVRRYERIAAGDRTLVLMDAPPAALDLRPFLAIGAWLRQQGLSAPEVLAADLTQGLVLLEDLGDDLFRPLLARGGAEEPLLYRTAIDLLVSLQRATPPPALKPYDDAWLLREAELLIEWYAPTLDQAARADYALIWRDLLPAARVGRDGFVYVDYHADNLLWLPARAGLARIGLLDFQDARLGPPAYDLVSLLADARRDTDPDLAQAMVEHYLSARPGLDRAAFGTACAVLGAQRNAKILGLFARLAERDGKRQYLALQPRVRAHLARALRHPALAPLGAWCERHLGLTAAA
jgi:aminoglycoside/choline kinase family phosphotransferase